MLPAGDSKLVQIMDTALADVSRRSGGWLVCHPGCTQCCIGVFAINQLDAARLREGLNTLSYTDAPRANAVRERARQSVERLASEFPGDPANGVLDSSAVAEARFEDFANDEPCPALDPASGLCDLYAARPMACRVFGPPVRTQDGLGVCELCYHGATDEQIESCEMPVDQTISKDQLLREFEQSSPRRGLTLVAFALVQDQPDAVSQKQMA